MLNTQWEPSLNILFQSVVRGLVQYTNIPSYHMPSTTYYQRMLGPAELSVTALKAEQVTQHRKNLKATIWAGQRI